MDEEPTRRMANARKRGMNAWRRTDEKQGVRGGALSASSRRGRELCSHNRRAGGGGGGDLDEAASQRLDAGGAAEVESSQ